jgi:hypothetical protein
LTEDRIAQLLGEKQDEAVEEDSEEGEDEDQPSQDEDVGDEDTGDKAEMFPDDKRLISPLKRIGQHTDEETSKENKVLRGDITERLDGATL